MFDRHPTPSPDALEPLESRLFLASDYRIVDLGTLGGEMSAATAINERGQIVGSSTTDDGQTRAFLYSNGRIRNLGSPKGESRALDISDRGHIGGYFINNSGSQRGFVHRRNEFTIMENLVREGPRESVVFAVERNGVAYGQSDGRPVVWHRADPRAMSARPGAVFGVGRGRTPVGELTGNPMSFRPPLMLDDADGRALDINRDREIVGWESVGGDRQAVLWKLSASKRRVLDRTVIGGLAEGPGTNAEFSTANAINDDGLVVGSSLTGNLAVRHAFLWEDGELHDLNDLVEDGGDWLLVSANDINQDGHIVGTGVIDGQEHAFLLEPIQEGPDIAVTLDGRELEDGDTVDFGVVQGSFGSATREFVIANEGRQRLRIRDVEVPFGYRLRDDPPTSLDPGELESFRIIMEADGGPGIRRGVLIIRTNDPDERVFDLDLIGRFSGIGFGARFKGFPPTNPRR